MKRIYSGVVLVTGIFMMPGLGALGAGEDSKTLVKTVESLNQNLNQGKTCTESDPVRSVDHHEGSNYSFVRCYLNKADIGSSDPRSRMMSLEMDFKDLKADPSLIDFHQNTTVKEIENPWVTKYQSTLSPEDRVKSNEILDRIERGETFSGNQYPPEFNSHFVINGPMIEADGAMTGLLIQDGVEKRALNQSRSDSTHRGNFYDLPFDPASGDSSTSGVIVIHTDGKVEAMTAEEASRKIPNMKDIKLAFQGGPILQKTVMQGNPPKETVLYNSNIKEDSPNRKPRVVACVTRGGKLRITSSNSEVGMNFYSVTQGGQTDRCYLPKSPKPVSPAEPLYVEHVFSDQQKCKFTLYLDGASTVVDANNVKSGLATRSGSGIKKNFFDFKLK